MRAVLVESLAGPAALRLAPVSDPVPAPGEVLVEVHAAGVTYPDVLQSRGLYQNQPELPFVPGLQAAGVVLSAPPAASVRPGDRVALLPWTGAFAELAVAPVEAVFAIPDGLSFTAAAVTPVNYLTVHFTYTERARLRSGETVLVHGAGGGLGSVALQYGRALGARMIAVVSSAQKGDLARRAGAHEVVAVEGFRQSVHELTAGRGVDMVFDPVGGDRVTDSLRCLASGGRLVVLGFTSGDIPSVKLNRLLLTNTEVMGISWGGYVASRPEYLQQQWREIVPMLESGLLEPIVGARFTLAEAAAAVGSLDQRTAAGNVVLMVRA